MSQEFFKNIIKPGVEDIDRDEKLNNKGLAFQKWLVNLFCEWDQDIDADDVRVLTSRDGGIDIMLFTLNQDRIHVIQAKYAESGPRTKNPVSRDVVYGFKNLREEISHEWINRSNLSEEAAEAYTDYLNKTKDGWQTTWWFITTGKLPEGVQGTAEDAHFNVYDTSGIKKIHKEADAQTDSIRGVTFSIADKNFFQLKEPRKTLIAVVRGNELRNLYEQHSRSLLAFNVRTFMGMGRNSINEKIISTAREEGENFLYFNNGISAICTKFEVKDGNRVVADQFQIINGGQTIGSIHKAGSNQDVHVLLKLCEGDGTATDAGFNRSIIRCNNTQNPIKDSDFRANDPIQNNIKKKFHSLKGIGKSALSKGIDYRPKRGGKRASPGFKALKLEDLARRRYAYKHNPCDPIEKAKLLWDVEGEYKKTFGDVNGAWSEDDFNEAVLALAFFDHIEGAIKKENAKEDKKFHIYTQLRYHILALARIYVQHRGVDVKSWKSQEKFQKIFDDFWKSQRYLVFEFQKKAEGKEVARGAISNLVRKIGEWRELKEKYEVFLESF